MPWGGWKGTSLASTSGQLSCYRCQGGRCLLDPPPRTACQCQLAESPVCPSPCLSLSLPACCAPCVPREKFNCEHGLKAWPSDSSSTRIRIRIHTRPACLTLPPPHRLCSSWWSHSGEDLLRVACQISLSLARSICQCNHVCLPVLRYSPLQPDPARICLSFSSLSLFLLFPSLPISRLAQLPCD